MTAEAEDIALCCATQEAIWLKQLQADLNMASETKVEILEDKQSVTINISAILFIIQA